jgi:hypothetical protein
MAFEILPERPDPVELTCAGHEQRIQWAVRREA